MVHQRRRRKGRKKRRLVGQAVKTPASHAGNTGSNPVRVTKGANEGEKSEQKEKSKTKKLKKYLQKEKINDIIEEKLVLKTLRVHPFPYRTRKLSSMVPKILGW